jgi:hypothetical protein
VGEPLKRNVLRLSVLSNGSSMIKQFVTPIPLKVWQDPQGDVVLHHSRDKCAVSFACWEAAGEPADYICQLKFDNAWAVRGVSSEFLPYEYEAHHRSCIYEVVDSKWLAQESELRGQSYPEWRASDRKEYHHYVVSGHDNFVEVIAASFEEQIVPRSDAGELVRLIDES